MYCKRPFEFFRTIPRRKRPSRFTSVPMEDRILYRAEYGMQAARWTLNSSGRLQRRVVRFRSNCASFPQKNVSAAKQVIRKSRVNVVNPNFTATPVNSFCSRFCPYLNSTHEKARIPIEVSVNCEASLRLTPQACRCPAETGWKMEDGRRLCL